MSKRNFKILKKLIPFPELDQALGLYLFYRVLLLKYIWHENISWQYIMKIKKKKKIIKIILDITEEQNINDFNRIIRE